MKASNPMGKLEESEVPISSGKSGSASSLGILKQRMSWLLLVALLTNLAGQLCSASPVKITPVGVWQLPGFHSLTSIFTTNGLAYVTDLDGLYIVDVSDPAHPVPLGLGASDWSSALSIEVREKYAFVGEARGFQIFDISTPSNPISVGDYDMTALFNNGILPNVEAIALKGDFAYLACNDAGLVVLDVSNPANPVQVGGDDSLVAGGIAIKGNYAYMSNRTFSDGSYLDVFDITDPTNPTRVGHLHVGGTIFFGIAVSGNYAYIPTFDDGLRIFDVSDPTNPVTVSTFTQEDVRDVVLIGDFAYLVGLWEGLRVLDISNPENPILSGWNDETSFGFGVAVDGNHAFVANTSRGLTIYQLDFPPVPWVFGPSRIAGDRLEMVLNGPATLQTVVLETSTNLSNWTPVATNTTASGVWTFSEPFSASETSRFYRAATW